MFYLDIKIIKLDQKLIICLAFISIESKKKEENFGMSKVVFGGKTFNFLCSNFQHIVVVVVVLLI